MQFSNYLFILLFVAFANVAQAGEFAGRWLSSKLGYNFSSPSANSTADAFYPGIEVGQAWDINYLLLGINANLDLHQHALTGSVYGVELKLGLPFEKENWLPYTKLGLALSSPGLRTQGGLGIEYKFSYNLSSSVEWQTNTKHVAGINERNDNFSIALNWYFNQQDRKPVVVALINPLPKYSAVPVLVSQSDPEPVQVLPETPALTSEPITVPIPEFIPVPEPVSVPTPEIVPDPEPLAAPISEIVPVPEPVPASISAPIPNVIPEPGFATAPAISIAPAIASALVIAPVVVPVIVAEAAPEPVPEPKPVAKPIVETPPPVAPEPNISVAQVIEEIKHKVAEGKPFTLTTEWSFEPNSAELLPAIFKHLDEVVKYVNEVNVKSKIEITGHTDSQGTPRFNFALSIKRAVAVKRYLMSKGVSVKRLIAKGKGLTSPVASNDTVEGRAKNRRVEIRFISAK
ncbi:MAG: OmpA family protein [Gallionellaceae bacterium]